MKRANRKPFMERENCFVRVTVLLPKNCLAELMTASRKLVTSIPPSKLARTLFTVIL